MAERGRKRGLLEGLQSRQTLVSAGMAALVCGWMDGWDAQCALVCVLCKRKKMHMRQVESVEW